MSNMVRAPHTLRIEEAHNDWEDMFETTSLPQIVYLRLTFRQLSTLDWNGVFYETSLWQHGAGRAFMQKYWVRGFINREWPDEPDR